MDHEFAIATTRFNTKTWNENVAWRENNKFPGCIYGTPKRVSDKMPLGKPMFIMEMQNDENVIKGIGLVRNTNVVGQRFRIYEDQNYNRYTYKGVQRIDRTSMNHDEEIIMRVMDLLVFKGERHLKRGQGIISIPSWIIDNKHIDFIGVFRKMFRTRKKFNEY